ncbi:MAG TPA: hypothetical protein ENJ82_00325 [Bacteroidetes bacterium]|nr:hypothetical protein [Bacteroidota bacterium]
MESFSGYSFCKAHSASFAVESYQSLFFKAHYPLEFMVGVINNFGGFYRTEVYLHEARRAGAVVHAPCVNHAGLLSRVQGVNLWLGFVHLLGLERKLAEAIVLARERAGLFLGLADLLQRTRLGLESVTILIRIGALRFTGKSKKKLLWEANMYFSKAPARKQATALFVPPQKDWVLPDLPDDCIEDAYDAIELLGFPIPPVSPVEMALPEEDHLSLPDIVRPPIFDLLACPLGKGEVVAAQLPQFVGKRVFISGYLICTKQVRTVRKDMMGFCDFVDVQGNYFDATLFPNVYMKYPLTGIGIYRMVGKVANDYGVPSLEVEAIERLSYCSDPRRA